MPEMCLSAMPVHQGDSQRILQLACQDASQLLIAIRNVQAPVVNTTWHNIMVALFVACTAYMSVFQVQHCWPNLQIDADQSAYKTHSTVACNIFVCNSCSRFVSKVAGLHRFLHMTPLSSQRMHLYTDVY